MGGILNAVLTRNGVSGELESDELIVPAGTLIGYADFSDGSTTPASIYPDTGWGAGVISGGAMSVVNGVCVGSYPDPTDSADFCYLNFYPPAGTTEFFVEFRAKMINPFPVKWMKAHGQDGGGGNRANCTYGLTAGGVMTQASFGDGATIGNDTQNVIAFNGSDPSDIGRSFGTAVVSTPAMAAYSGMTDEQYHIMRVHHKFNSGSTAENEVPNGRAFVSWDGVTYVDATGLLNRHYSNAPIDRIGFFGYVNAAPGHGPAEIHIDWIKISTGGFV